MSDDTMRDDLNAAIEEFEEKEDGAEAGAGTDADAGGDNDSGGVPDADDSGDGFASDSAPDDVVASVDNLSDDELPGDSPSTPVSEAPTGLKAPAGWNPQQREQWSKIPQDIQEHISARETEMATSMANTSESRTVHDRMQQLGQAYAPIMAAEGVTDPVQAAEGLFQTVSQLRMGNAQQKAATIAQMIKHYGVDVAELDNNLSGQQAESPVNSEVERLLEQKMAPFNQMMQLLEKAKGEQATQTKANAQKEVEAFASSGAEFIGDVRNDMADMIDFAHAQGREMTLQDAYNKAVAMNPQIAKVLEGRKIMNQNNSVQKKKAASSSLNGKRSGITAPPAGGGSMREDIMSAFESLQSD